MRDVTIRINGHEVAVSPETSVAAALTLAGVSATRTSVSGQPRAPLCAMGICYECRVTIDGQPHRLGCQTLCREGMEIRTDA